MSRYFTFTLENASEILPKSKLSWDWGAYPHTPWPGEHVLQAWCTVSATPTQAIHFYLTTWNWVATAPYDMVPMWMQLLFSHLMEDQPFSDDSENLTNNQFGHQKHCKRLSCSTETHSVQSKDRLMPHFHLERIISCLQVYLQMLQVQWRVVTLSVSWHIHNNLAAIFLWCCSIHYWRARHTHTCTV